MWSFALVLLIAGSGEVLTLDSAMQQARDHQPQLRQAHAVSDAAAARADESFSSLLPQVSGSAGYQRATQNFVARPGTVPAAFASQLSSKPGFNTTNYWNFGVTASQLLWDFGTTWNTWHASRADAEASQFSERGTLLQVSLDVRSNYFNAQACKALLEVAQQTLANQDRHVQQIQGFVRVGTRPEIDLAQVRTDRANAKVQLVTAENNYLTAKTRLNVSMGMPGSTDYDVTAIPLEPVSGEELETAPLVTEAIEARPELLAFQRQIAGDELRQSATLGNYGPSLGVSTGVTEAGAQLDNMAWNWNAQLTLSWNIFQGGLTAAQSREAAANIQSRKAQYENEAQQVHLEVEQARLAVRAARESLVAAEEALENAKLRLRLAEGRYSTGVGNIIEQGDAQLAQTNAAGQQVQAVFNLSTARAQLIKALGRL